MSKSAESLLLKYNCQDFSFENLSRATSIGIDEKVDEETQGNRCGDYAADMEDNQFETELRRRTSKIINCAKENIENGNH